MPLGCETPTFAGCHAQAEEVSVLPGRPQLGSRRTQTLGVAAVTCADSFQQHVYPEVGGRNLELLLHLPRALRATACGAQRSAKVSGGQWLSVTGDVKATKCSGIPAGRESGAAWKSGHMWEEDCNPQTEQGRPARIPDPFP